MDWNAKAEEHVNSKYPRPLWSQLVRSAAKNDYLAGVLAYAKAAAERCRPCMGTGTTYVRGNETNRENLKSLVTELRGHVDSNEAHRILDQMEERRVVETSSCVVFAALPCTKRPTV